MKALVVDDSALMRRKIGEILLGGGFEVETARTGAEALERVLAQRPDVVTLDINMPEMDGLTCLGRIMEEAPVPVVMVSSLTSQGALASLEAVALGAVDFMEKPGGTVSVAIGEVADLLLQKVKSAARARLRRTSGLRDRMAANRARILAAPPRRRERDVSGHVATAEALTLVGASTGGPSALEEVLSALSASYPTPVLVCQHMPGSITPHFAQRLDEVCNLDVVEVRRQTVLEPGTVYIGRGDADLLVMQRGGRLVAHSVPSAASIPWHPSVDRMVESAMANVTADSLIGVLLTGMGDDGARSMAALRRAGGETIAESEESCVVYGMPRALVEAGGATETLPVERIGARLEQVANRVVRAAAR